MSSSDPVDVREEFTCGDHNLRLATTTRNGYLLVFNGPGDYERCPTCRQAWDDAREAAEAFEG